MFKLIVNGNGLLSACPTDEDFKKTTYHTVGMALFDVAMSDVVRVQLWHQRDNAWIIGEGLPERVDEPGRVYFEVVNDRLIVASSYEETAV